MASSQDLNVLSQGISLEQALEEPDLTSISERFEDPAHSSGMASGIRGGGMFSGLFSILAMDTAPAPSNNPCETWHLSTKGCSYLKSLISQEKLAHETDNYHGLIFFLALLIENELLELLAKPLRAYAPEIAQILKHDNPGYHTEALEAWAENTKIKPTFWTLVQILKGLELADQKISPELDKQIKMLFIPEYSRFIKKANISKAADTFRREFRNPCCHPERDSFTEEEADRACKLTLGYQSIDRWITSSSDREKHTKALLSTHLVFKRQS